MKIDSTNYEIWLMDWIDGNLNPIQTEQFRLFLSKHPELLEEYEDLTTFNLKPFSDRFAHKDLLIKSSADLNISQFELLCIASLEKDLSPEQEAEVIEAINNDTEKKRSFELIRQTKLSATEARFKNKNKLFKRTRSQNVFRLSAIGLSTAAAIALIIITYFSAPRSSSEIINSTGQNILVDNILENPRSDIQTVTNSVENRTVLNIQKNSRPLEEKNNSGLIRSDSSAVSSENSLLRDPESSGFLLKKVPVSSDVQITNTLSINILVKSKFPPMSSNNADERNKLQRFIAKTFREKLLKENPSPDTPLKGYEFAEAGVSGLNKLLGWEMALDVNNDSNGELKSVYFNSKILKFKTPVKKAEPLQ